MSTAALIVSLSSENNSNDPSDLNVTGDIILGNQTEIITDTGTNYDMFTYDTTQDSDGGAWINDITAQSSSWYNETLDAIERTEELIGRYYRLNPSLGEQTALDDIKNTLYKYKEKLEVAKKLTEKGSTPEQIDKQVRIYDRHALRGLDTLDQDIILQIENKSGQLSKALIEINTEGERYTYISVTVILALAVYLFVMFSKKIINPVRDLSVVMSELAQGNTAIDFEYPEMAKTELGEIARALKVFQKNEHKRKQAEEEIRRLAMTDPLTGLANRNQFELRYKELVSLATRENKFIALFALDLDKFKPINDEYGHAAGDEVLKSVARNLMMVFRETDLVARLGGDEFSIVLYAPESLETIKAIAERVIQLLSTSILVNEDMLTIGASIGIAIREHTSHETMKSLMQYADKSLYEAKEAGRNTYRIYNNGSAQKTISIV